MSPPPTVPHFPLRGAPVDGDAHELRPEVAVTHPGFLLAALVRSLSAVRRHNDVQYFAVGSFGKNGLPQWAHSRD